MRGAGVQVLAFWFATLTQLTLGWHFKEIGAILIGCGSIDTITCVIHAVQKFSEISDRFASTLR